MDIVFFKRPIDHSRICCSTFKYLDSICNFSCYCFLVLFHYDLIHEIIWMLIRKNFHMLLRRQSVLQLLGGIVCNVWSPFDLWCRLTPKLLCGFCAGWSTYWWEWNVEVTITIGSEPSWSSMPLTISQNWEPQCLMQTFLYL